MRRFGIVTAIVLLGQPLTGCQPEEEPRPLQRLVTPTGNKLYHGVYPGSLQGAEDDLTIGMLRSYEDAVGKKVAWVYFSHNWYKSRDFPTETAEWIRETGAVPYIRLMTRSDPKTLKGDSDPAYSLDKFLAGKFDEDLKKWARSAKAFGWPLIVEWGTECNGSWFGWNGKWNGGKTKDGYGDPNREDGPERFIAAYRHVVTTIRGAGAKNITWVFHVDDYDLPEEQWNHFENYYPGDKYVDWVGLSSYGAVYPTDTEAYPLKDSLDHSITRLQSMTSTRPFFLVEFGIPHGMSIMPSDKWASEALDNLLTPRWPRFHGFSWWNERWANDDNPQHDTDMRVYNISTLAAAFKKMLSKHAKNLLTRPVVEDAQ